MYAAFITSVITPAVRVHPAAGQRPDSYSAECAGVVDLVRAGG